jgi:hypothetical protein
MAEAKELYLDDPESFILGELESFQRRREDETRRHYERVVDMTEDWATLRDKINRWAGIYGKPTTYEVIDRELNKQR